MARKPKLAWGPKGYLALPKALMEHPDFRELSTRATKVLMRLCSQYNGKNNGDLAATVKMMESWGGMAKGTLAAALTELRERNLIIKSRTHYKGRDGARPTLYAITWVPIDPCTGKGLDIDDTDKAPRTLR
jgi:hypothetical protein